MKLKEIILSLSFIILGITTRTIFHLGPNIEFVTGVSLAAGFFINNQKLRLLIPMLIMLISDLIIGNSYIFLFTWSAFLIAPVLGNILKKQNDKLEGNKFLKLFVISEFGGVLFTIFFYLWTNFGVVITTDMYEKSLSGLAQSYVSALPFLTPQLLSNLLIVPFVFIASYIALNYKIIFASLQNSLTK